MANQLTPLYLITTSGDIVTEEVERTLNHGQAILKRLAREAGYSSLYSFRDEKQDERLTLYLMLCAIETWDNADGATNYFTVEEMRSLLDRTQQLFGICS